MSNNNSGAEELAAIFGALGNPHRLELFRTLLACCEPGGECDVEDDGSIPCVGDIARTIAIAPSTLSHHLKELNRAGLIDMERRGKKVYLGVREETVAQLSRFFGEAASCCHIATSPAPRKKTGTSKKGS